MMMMMMMNRWGSKELGLGSSGYFVELMYSYDGLKMNIFECTYSYIVLAGESVVNNNWYLFPFSFLFLDCFVDIPP